MECQIMLVVVVLLVVPPSFSGSSVVLVHHIRAAYITRTLAYRYITEDAACRNTGNAGRTAKRQEDVRPARYRVDSWYVGAPYMGRVEAETCARLLRAPLRTHIYLCTTTSTTAATAAAACIIYSRSSRFGIKQQCVGPVVVAPSSGRWFLGCLPAAASGNDGRRVHQPAPWRTVKSFAAGDTAVRCRICRQLWQHPTRVRRITYSSDRCKLVVRARDAIRRIQATWLWGAQLAASFASGPLSGANIRLPRKHARTLLPFAQLPDSSGGSHRLASARQVFCFPVYVCLYVCVCLRLRACGFLLILSVGGDIVHTVFVFSSRRAAIDLSHKSPAAKAIGSRQIPNRWSPAPVVSVWFRPIWCCLLRRIHFRGIYADRWWSRPCSRSSHGGVACRGTFDQILQEPQQHQQHTLRHQHFQWLHQLYTGTNAASHKHFLTSEQTPSFEWTTVESGSSRQAVG